MQKKSMSLRVKKKSSCVGVSPSNLRGEDELTITYPSRRQCVKVKRGVTFKCHVPYMVIGGAVSNDVRFG